MAVAVGPVLGGWLLEHFSWASVFWVNVPRGAAALLAIGLLVPGTRPESVSRFDLPGLMMSALGLGLLTYSVIEGPHHGWTSLPTIVGFGGAAAVLALFVRRQLGIANPILNVRLFTNRYFATAAGMISTAFFALFGFIFLIPQFFQAVKGYSPLEAGLLPFAVVMAVFSPVAMALSQRIGVRTVAVAGALFMSAGFGLVELADETSGYWSLIAWSMALMAVGLAFVSGPCTQLIMDALTPELAGAGAAVNDTTREVGGALGVAVLGSVLTSVYTTGVLGPAGRARGTARGGRGRERVGDGGSGGRCTRAGARRRAVAGGGAAGLRRRSARGGVDGRGGHGRRGGGAVARFAPRAGGSDGGAACHRAGRRVVVNRPSRFSVRAPGIEPGTAGV